MNTILAYLFLTYSQEFKLPPGLLQAVCKVESGLKTEVVNYEDGESPSYGVCQVKLETARTHGFTGTPAELRTPTNNIYYAGKILAYSIRKCGSLASGLYRYNTGRCPFYTQSSSYTRRVFYYLSSNMEALNDQD